MQSTPVVLFLWGKPPSGLTYGITIVRGQGREGVCVEDRSIYVLGVEIPSVYLLPRRDEYTRVYTTVYPRVHNSIHACTLPRSKYILCRACLYVCFLGIMPRIFSDELRLPGYEIIPPKIQRLECTSEIMRRPWSLPGEQAPPPCSSSPQSFPRLVREIGSIPRAGYTFLQAKEDTALICEQMRVLDRVCLTACLSDVLRGDGRSR